MEQTVLMWCVSSVLQFNSGAWTPEQAGEFDTEKRAETDAF